MFIRTLRSTLVGPVLVVAGCVGASPAASSATAGESVSSGDDGSNIIVMNGLSPIALAANALLTHPSTPQVLVSRPLVDASFANRSELLGVALHDASARAVFQKIVTCAMPPGKQIHWRDPFVPANLYTFDGQLGLASGWRDRGASEDEQEVVSACVLMLMNDVGYHIPVSPRGYAVGGRRIDASVDAHIWPYSDLGAPDPRFADCPPGAGMGVRECGWDVSQSYVGTCVGASWGAVGIDGAAAAGSPAIGTGAGARLLRVCDGLLPCAANSLGLVEDDDQQHAVAYRCSATGGGTGFFAAMTGAGVAGAAFTARPATTIASAMVPARALDVYRTAEAGFFGNVFTGVLAPGVDPVFVDPGSGVVMPTSHRGLPAGKGAIYPGLYYCEAPDWTHSDGFALHRLCADAGRQTDCVASDVGACKLHCTLPGPDDQGAFADCRPDPTSAAYHTLTDYLSDRCAGTYGCPSH